MYMVLIFILMYFFVLLIRTYEERTKQPTDQRLYFEGVWQSQLVGLTVRLTFVCHSVDVMRSYSISFIFATVVVTL